MLTCPNPSTSAASTSGAAPWLNHSVNRRSMSCNDPDLPLRASAPPSATERKKPEMAGATCLFAAAAGPTRAYCSIAAALNKAQWCQALAQRAHASVANRNAVKTSVSVASSSWPSAKAQRH